MLEMICTTTRETYWKWYITLKETYWRWYGGSVEVILSSSRGSCWNDAAMSEQWTCLSSRLLQHQQSAVPQVVWFADILDDAWLEWNRWRSTLEDGVDERAQSTRVTVFLHNVTAAADERTDDARQRLQPRHMTCLHYHYHRSRHSQAPLTVNQIHITCHTDSPSSILLLPLCVSSAMLTLYWACQGLF